MYLYINVYNIITILSVCVCFMDACMYACMYVYMCIGMFVFMHPSIFSKKSD